MTAIQPIPPTQNEAWGFWGTMGEQASAAWPLAMIAIADATGEPLKSIRIFLDTSHGRYFADEVRNGLSKGLALADAIQAATQRWMSWKIGSQTYKKHGIPQVRCPSNFAFQRIGFMPPLQADRPAG